MVHLDSEVNHAGPRSSVLVNSCQVPSAPIGARSLLNRAVPALSQFLYEYNTRTSRADRLHQQLRVRVVVHAGEVHYDGNGCFGEALDIAFRLLDAAGVKKALSAAADPLTLVISHDIFRTIVRHGYDGIDPPAFRPLTRVHIAGH